ncbi:MAG: energy transducer TonB [Thermoanaerobaculia bacterium]
MLQLVTPPERPRPALLASIGLHVAAVSAFGFGPLLAFPEAPGWRGEVWVVTQPVLRQAEEVKVVDLRDRVPKPPSPSGSTGGLPAAPQAGPAPEPSAPTTQPTDIQNGMPVPPEVEPVVGAGVPGGVGDGDGRSTGTGTDPDGGDGETAIDARRGVLPPDIVLPVPLETPSPHYPDSARISHATGVVVLSATIAADGRVVEVEAEPGANPLLARAALEAVSHWRYVPARIGPRRVAVILRVTLTFRLN